MVSDWYNRVTTEVRIVRSSGAANNNTVIRTNFTTGGIDTDNDYRAVQNNANGFDAGTIRINGRDQVAPNP